jgi:hypothetical protein
MEHAIHLGACHFISNVTPTTFSKIGQRSRSKASGRGAQHIDLDQLDHGDSGDESVDDGNDPEVRDAISKALALVKQVCDPSVS